MLLKISNTLFFSSSFRYYITYFFLRKTKSRILSIVILGNPINKKMNIIVYHLKIYLKGQEIIELIYTYVFNFCLDFKIISYFLREE